MNNILVIGSGSREVSIIKKILQDNKSQNIICIGTHNNPFILENCELYIFQNYNVNEFYNFLENKNNIDFAIIGPEAPLELGFADILENKNIPCLGPLKLYANIETSKIYARNFIDQCGLSKYSPKYTVLDNVQNINNILSDFNKIVIKKDGLCGGKGVKVEDIDFTKNDISNILNEDLKNNKKLLIEEKLEGKEFSLMTITDGNNNFGHFPPIHDYKRLNNNNEGPNTGSMGCLIDSNNNLPFLNENDLNIANKINENIIKNLNLLGDKNNCKIGYRGILYGSFIKSKDGNIYIIEFNSRFGDPESIVALSLLKNNFIELCNQIENRNLQTKLVFEKKAMISIYLVPKTYPFPSKDKYDIYLDDSIKDDIIFGHVEKNNNHLYSLSSRSLVLSVKDECLNHCFKKIYNKIKLVKGFLKFRNDIGSEFLSKYEQAGVSINEGNNALKKMKKYITNTYNENVLGKYGDFGGQFKLGEYNLVSSIDGVGTKSILANKIYGEESFINLGKDIVNHSVNDILVQGAYPLFFLDYFGTAHLKINEISNFIKGVSEACIENGKIPIIGGETAEMPDIYMENKTDLVGCIIGLKHNEFFKNTQINSGDILLGLPSVSPHTNGYSLINKIINDNELPNNDLLDILVKPHKSYLKEVNEFVKLFGYESIKSMCHITGGGLNENLKRVIPNDKEFLVNNLPELPKWCKFIQEKGNIELNELKRVFNCGIGFVILISPLTFTKLEKTTVNFNYYNIGIII